MEVGEIENSMFFLNGWQQFLMEKSVEEGDFLVFRYAENSIFYFFGFSYCQLPLLPSTANELIQMPLLSAAANEIQFISRS